MFVNLDLHSLWRHKLILLVCAILGLLGGFAYIQFTPITYEAQARVLIEPRAVSTDADPLGRVVPEFIPTQAETIRSPLTVRKAVEKTTVHQPPSADPTEFDPVEHVLKSLIVTPLVNANVVTVSYRSINEEESVALINHVIQSYEGLVNDFDKGSSGTKVQLVAEREKKLRSELRQLEKSYEDLRQSSPVIGQGRAANQDALVEIELANRELIQLKTQKQDLVARLTSMLEDEFQQPVDKDLDPVLLAQLQVRSKLTTEGEPVFIQNRLTLKKPALDKDNQANTEKNNNEKNNIEINKANSNDALVKTKEYLAKSSDILQALQYSDPITSREINQLFQDYKFSVLQVNKLDETLADKHPRLVEALEQSLQYRKLLEKRFQNILQSWQLELHGIQKKESELEAEIKQKRSTTKANEIYLVKEENLSRHIEDARQLHAATLQQLISLQGEESAITQGRNSIEIQVLDEAKIISDMTWPKPKLLLPASVIVGLLFGLSIVAIISFNKNQAAESEESPSSQSDDEE